MALESYFAYGSNMSIRQMKDRCSSARYLANAVLPGHRLTFPVKSSRWGGGAAWIVADEGEHVEGIVYEISREDLGTLDKFEGSYYRDKVEVKLEGEPGDSLEVWVYIPKSNAANSIPPTKKYVETMLEGAREHRLGQDFIKYLEQLIAA